MIASRTFDIVAEPLYVGIPTLNFLILYKFPLTLHSLIFILFNIISASIDCQDAAGATKLTS